MAQLGQHKLSSVAAAQLVQDYVVGGSTMPQLKKRFGVCLFTVRDYLLRAGVQPRRSGGPSKALRNPGAFALADSNEEAAYWVGFLMADGNVGVGQHASRLQMALAWVDAEHVARLHRFLGSEAKLSVDRSTNKRRQHACHLTVRSERLVADLAQYGVLPQKSSVAWVKGGLENNLHFWRGAVDGDGHLGISKRGFARLELCGSWAMMDQFAGLVRHLVVGANPLVRQGDGCCWKVQLGSAVATKMVEYLYGGAQIALPRKAKVAAEIIRRGVPERSRYRDAA